MRFRPELPDRACGKEVATVEYAFVCVCMRTEGHPGACMLMAQDAFAADGRCKSCFAPGDHPHFSDCQGGLMCSGDEKMESTDSAATLNGRDFLRRAQDVGVRAELSQRSPAWLNRVWQQCQVFLEYSPDWDTYGALPIQQATVEGAIELLTNIAGPGLPAPDVSPTPMGGVHFEWVVGSKALELTFFAPGRVSALFVDESTGRVWEKGNLGSDLTPVIAELRSFTTP